VHDLFGAGDTHHDSVISNGGNGFVIRHNTLSCDVGTPGNASTGGGCSGGVVLLGDFSPIDDVVVDNNLINGGAYCMYAGSLSEKPYPNATNVRVTNNRFGTALFAKCGVFGPVTGYSPNAGNVFTGNAWADTLVPINP
jgi:hypothetical protein